MCIICHGISFIKFGKFSNWKILIPLECSASATIYLGSISVTRPEFFSWFYFVQLWKVAFKFVKISAQFLEFEIIVIFIFLFMF